MELRQLAYFVAVVDRAGFTAAAAELHVAQPGVSAQVRQLERELGVALFDRSGRRVRLTAAGAAVLPYARAALAAADAARLAADELAGLVRGRVAVGMVVACTAVGVLELLSGFRRRHPGIEVSLTEASSDDLVERLREGSLDLAWVAVGPQDPPGLTLQVLADEAIVAAVAPGDPLAGRDRLEVGELAGRPLVCLPAGSAVRACLAAACRAAGLVPQVALEASDPRMVAQLAARGLGVGILPESTAAALAPALRAVPVASPHLRGRVALAWRAAGPAGPAARALIAFARSGGVDAGGRP